MNTRTNLISRKGLKQILLSSVSLALIFSMLMFSSGIKAYAEMPAKKAYTGEEIYRGLVLGDGEVAEMFPEVWEGYKAAFENNNEWQVVKETVVSEISSNDPEYFENFRQEIQSGDHIRIRAAMENGVGKMREHSNAYMSKLKAGANKEDGTLLVVVYVCMIISICEIIWIIVLPYPPVIGTENAQVRELQRDKYVDSIADRMAIAD